MNKRRRYKAKRRRRLAERAAVPTFGGTVRVIGQVSEHVKLAAERIRKFFVHVPMTDAELNFPDPDYGF